MAASIQQDVVWLDISVSNFSEALLECPGSWYVYLCMNSSLWTASIAMIISAT